MIHVVKTAFPYSMVSQKIVDFLISCCKRKMIIWVLKFGFFARPFLLGHFFLHFQKEFQQPYQNDRSDHVIVGIVIDL